MAPATRERRVAALRRRQSPCGRRDIIDQKIAWRVFCKGISKDEALAGATLLGDRVLASKALEMISVIA